MDCSNPILTVALALLALAIIVGVVRLVRHYRMLTRKAESIYWLDKRVDDLWGEVRQLSRTVHAPKETHHG